MLPSSVRAFVATSPIQRTPIAQAVVAFAEELPAGTRVLDAGAGEAPYRPLLSHCDYLTQDWPGTVHPGARQADIVADLQELPVEAGSFDAVVCTEVLEHVARPDRALAEIHRVLRPGGQLLVTVPFVVELHEEPHDHGRYTSHGLRALLEDAGFRVRILEPSTGWFSTLAQTLRHQAVSTTPPGVAPALAARLTGSVFLVLSEVLRRIAPVLDRRLDTRHALPLGWIVRAERPA